MLVDVQYDQDVFVNGLVTASHKMRDLHIHPESMTVPQTTFNHFKNTLHYQQMFDNHDDWKRRLWNSKHNPLNFDIPMFMGIRIKIIPDKESPKGVCYLHSGSQFGDNKVPFEYSLRLVREHKIKNNLVSILVKSRADDYRNAPKNEWRAIDTLREMITEAEFRKYMKYGFILVRGQSGKIYQVFRNKSHTIVREKDEVVEEVCVRIKDRKIPPTDNVIAFKILIESSEEDFKKLGNVYNMRMAV
jgi:hypothetical protein